MQYIEQLTKKSFLKMLIAALIIGFMFFFTQDIIFSKHSTNITNEFYKITDTHKQETNSNLIYLFAVFFITWVAFFGYLFFLSKKQQDIMRDVKELENILSQDKSKNI